MGHQLKFLNHEIKVRLAGGLGGSSMGLLQVVLEVDQGGAQVAFPAGAAPQRGALAGMSMRCEEGCGRLSLLR